MKMLSDKIGMSEEGRLWMENCLDPFCDEKRRAVGFPDLIIGNSVVQVIKKSFTYTNNSGGLQDVHIFNDNIDQPIKVQQQLNNVDGTPGGLVKKDWVYAGVGSTYPRGGIVIRAATSNTPLTTQTTIQNIALDSTFFEGGPTRVLSKAFEVHNTTPLIQQGGGVTCYRDATTRGTKPDEIAGITAAAGIGRPERKFPAYPLAVVPETQAECLILPGARQWEAKDGVMAVSVMNSQVNDPEDDPRGLAYLHDSDCAVDSDWVTFPVNFTATSTIPYLSPAAALAPSPFFVTGAYHTGLPNGTSLQVTAIWIIERFVDQTKPDLVVMAQPSPSYDPVALEAYSRTAHNLPCAVVVKNNAEGDWIKEVADLLGDFGVPGMGIVKGAVNVGQKVFGSGGKQSAEVKRLEELEKKLAEYEKMFATKFQGPNVTQTKPQQGQPNNTKKTVLKIQNPNSGNSSKKQKT